MSGEAKIADAVMDWLQAQGWDCYPEVMPARGGPRADIVGVRGNLVMVCEVKTSMSLSLLSQAIAWHGQAHFIYVATPARKRARWGGGANTRAEDHIFGYYGLGHLTVNADYSKWKDQVEEKRPPAYKRPHSFDIEMMRACLHPDMKRYNPGTQTGYSTPWKRTMDSAVKYVEAHQGCTIKELLADVETHYASDASARACLKEWLPADPRVRVDTEAKPFRYYPREAR